MKNTLFFILIVLLPSKLLAAEVPPYQALAEQQYWLKLGHYRPHYAKWQSDVDDQQFFIAKNGKNSPLAELQATIDAFNGLGLNKAQVNARRCQFPARYTWLKKQLKNDWPQLDCPELSTWQKVINPKGVTLVFPTAFMNSPSSMFGHTLLRIDAKDQTRHKELVAFAVNFAAEPDSNDNAAMYALKGLIGSYPGNFTLMPYYRKVREYNDIESRDMWEYKLNLSEQEVTLILLHLWELQSATFDYYFIDENCSYQLLALLQLARAELDLTSSFTMHAIPSDTVAVLNEKGLLQKPAYRPAFGTKLYHYATQLTDAQLLSARALMRGEQADLSSYNEKQTVAILEMAYEWLNFEFYDQGLARDEIAPRLTSLLRTRSQYKVNSPFTAPLQPIASPEQGHGSSRFGANLTDYKQQPNQATFSYRLAYHDLLDDSAGFIPGAQISFFDIAASVNSNNKIKLERLYLLDAMSLAPDNRVFDSWSWNIQAGFERQPAATKRAGRYFAKGGYGKSFGDPNNLHGFVLASFELNSGDITNGVKPGLGSEAGLIWQAAAQHKVALMGNIFWLTDSGKTQHSEVTFSWNWSLADNWALRNEIQYQHWQSEQSAAKVNLFYYF